MSLAPENTLPPLRTSSTDDPDVVAEQRADDYTSHLVPTTARVGRWQLTMSFWSLLSAMVWLFYGALAAGLYGTSAALTAIGVSVVTYSLINMLLAGWARRSGLNSTLLSRRMFGVMGASLTALLVAANTTYYAVFESSTLAVAFEHYTPGWDVRVWYAIVALVMLPLMLGGVQTWMARLNGVLLPLYLVGIVVAVVVAAIRFDGGGWLSFQGIVPPEARPMPGWLLSVILYMGIYLTMPTTVDFARFARAEDDRFHKHVTFGWVFYTFLFAANGAAGIFLVRAAIPDRPAAETGVVEAIIATLGAAGLVLIVVSQARINSLNYYQASSNWERLIAGLTGRRLGRIPLVLATTAVVFLLMLTDVFSYLNRALTWQGVFLVSWVGIALTHYALVPEDRARGPEFRALRLPRATWGLAAWVVAAGTGIYCAEGPGVPALLAEGAPAVALVLSVVLYAVVVKARPLVAPAAPDPRLEVEDAAATRAECHRCAKSYIVLEMDREPAAGDAPVCDGCATATLARRR
ncbi:purine-cytosine permease family protein [Actinomadura montaniterrae]|uniref:Permease n=1 Tax=Actinomadura montaniterrae TaxID=1803903 RepID=A0A6L3W3T0_9ACTN|nr:cytosine permease [Actinomadura montaniterrae]KAB2388205.1 permease [Actinomadura montaniterrae]